MSYEEAVAYILQIPKFTAKNSLSHTKEFLKRLGSPEAGKKVIHVAGTNGKGSVCAYLQALLLSERKQTGTFTSPHLIKINERIRLNGVMITDEQFLEAFQTVAKATEEMEQGGLPHPTFFEFLFGMGMVVFDKCCMEYVILETGLGGRLDATNAVEHPCLTMLTAISLDHMEILGDTIEKIAAEKTGILKKGVPVICDANEPRSLAVILNAAAKKQVPCREISKNAYEIKEMTEKYIAFSCTDAYYESVMWITQSGARYQVNNALLALEAMRFLLGDSEKHLEKWKKSLELVRWEGRMEEVIPGVIVDGAHNMGGIQAFVESVQTIGRRRTGKTVVVFSAVQEKAYEDMAAYLCRHMEIDLFIITQIDNSRGVPAKKLASVFQEYTNHDMIIEEELEKALNRAMKEKEEDGTVYCLGSLYLVGRVKELL